MMPGESHSQIYLHDNLSERYTSSTLFSRLGGRLHLLWKLASGVYAAYGNCSSLTDAGQEDSDAHT